MASIDDILAKKKEQVVQIKAQSDLEPTLVRKKIERSGKERPWRENLDKRISADDFLKIIENENEHIKRDIDRSTLVVPVKTDNKPETNHQINLGQSSDEPRKEVKTNLGQTSDKLRTHSIALSEVINKSSDKPKTQPRTEVRSNLGQTSDKLRTNVSFIGLVGLQREIILFLFETLKITLDKITPPIAISHLAVSCKTTVFSAQKTLQRLGKAGLVERVEFKNGRSGWTRYSLNERIYGEILQSESSDKLKTNLGQSSDKLKTQPRTELRTSAPIVVVKELNTKNTTNTEEPCFVIPNELAGKVSRRQLSEFVLDGKISEYDLQLSLDAFAYDLRNKLVSAKYSNNPVGVLIGAIKNNGSYNSAKFVEAVKAEMKPFIDSQRETSAIKADQRSSKEWESFQKFKQEKPEEVKKLEEKSLKIGFEGAMLDEFTFLEFKKQILKIDDEMRINPLRPPVESTP